MMMKKNTIAKLLAEEDIFVVHKQMETAYFDVKNRELGLPIWKENTMEAVEEELLVCHEIGHALGLKHPFETSARNFDTLTDDENVISNTIMSYTVSLSSDVVGLTAYPTTPMIEDIKAIQHLYGTNNTFNLGNTSYFFDDSTTYFETIWDSGGTASCGS